MNQIVGKDIIAYLIKIILVLTMQFIYSTLYDGAHYISDALGDRPPSSSIAYIKNRIRFLVIDADTVTTSTAGQALLQDIFPARRYGYVVRTMYQEFLGKSPLTQNWYQMSIIHLIPTLEIRSSAKKCTFMLASSCYILLTLTST